MTLAKDLVRKMGKKLIGRKVITPPMGSYPGGLAQVIEIHPDPAAPEIVFNVENPAGRDDNGTHVIGVFGVHVRVRLRGRHHPAQERPRMAVAARGCAHGKQRAQRAGGGAGRQRVVAHAAPQRTQQPLVLVLVLITAAFVVVEVTF